MNNNYLCVLDFETVGSTSPTENTCQPVQLSSVIIHPRKLEIIKNSEFDCVICPEYKPEEIPEDSYNFHSKVSGLSKEQLINKWYEGQSIKQAWENFVQYLEKWHKPGKKKSFFSAPLCCGYNNFAYDDHIIQRLAKRYGNINEQGGQNLFFSRDGFDVMKLIIYFFENDNEVNSFSFDKMHEVFGMSKAGAHNSLVDVKQTAELLIRFLKLSRSLKVRFKGAFSGS